MFVSSRFALLLCSASCILLISESKKCPDRDDIDPCECSEPNFTSDDNLTTYFCNFVPNLPTLKNVIASSGDHPFPKWVMGGLFAPYVPAFALKAKSVQQFHLTYSTVVGLFDRMPDVNRRLHRVSVEQSKILRGVEWELFRNFHNLTELIFEDTHLRSLGKDFQENVQPSLVYLTLRNTNISKLGDEVFSKLINLKEITVIQGKIATLKRSMFPRVNVITELNFWINLIESLPDDIFNNMPKLKFVNMNYNRLTTVSETVFGKLKGEIMEVVVYDNNIKCDCKIRWIVQRGGETIKGDCAEPHDMKGKELLSIGDDLDYCDDI